MRISYFPNQTANHSEQVWQAFLSSCESMGIRPEANSMDSDYLMIWSVLWRGRMQKNQQVYQHYIRANKPVFILEVGSIQRRTTWKVAVNNITNQGIYPEMVDPDRPKKLGIVADRAKINKDLPILIALQQTESLQWDLKKSAEQWVTDTVTKIRRFTDRQIVIRPHPRARFHMPNLSNTVLETPKKIINTYDDYDLNFDYSAVINHNSGVAVQAALRGVPVVTDNTSLAYPVSMPLSSIDIPYLPDRDQWIQKMSHTEWTVDEIAQGTPLRLLIDKIKT
jgi:hypothetical protein